MTEFTIHMHTTVSAWVKVEAETEEEAREMVENGDVEMPYAPGFANYEFGDEWEIEDAFEGNFE